MPTPSRRIAVGGSYVVALILAIGISTALNLLVFAVLYDAIYSETTGISENATQILTGWGGGVLGVIGAVVGYQAGSSANRSASAGVVDTPVNDTVPGSGSRGR